MQITKKDFDKIIGYTRDKLLECTVNVNSIPMIVKPIVQSLPNLVTLEGFLKATGEKKERVKKNTDDDFFFKQWWDAFPIKAEFKYRGMVFKSTRILRSNYDVCLQLFNKALANGTDPEKMITGLKYHVQEVKKESYKDNQNKLQYFSGSETYLRQGKYEAYLDTELIDEEEEDNDILN